MLKRALRMARYGFLLFKIGGSNVFFSQLRRQIYSRETLIRVERNLDTGDLFDVPSRLEYSLRLASEEDMEEVFQQAKSESKESAHRWVYRRWCYQAGYHNCYVARAAETSGICHVHWMISPEEDNVVRPHVMALWPKLNEDECLLENAYTFERYRGMKIMPSVQARLCKIARINGFKRVLAFGQRDTGASIKGAEMAGYKRVEEVLLLRFLFFTRQKNRPLISSA